jgi:hypothetical protein
MIPWKFAPKNSIIDRPSCSNLVEDLFSADFISRDFIGSDVMKGGTRLNKIISQICSIFLIPLEVS